MKRLFIVLGCTLSMMPAYAQIESPEECILNTLKSGNKENNLIGQIGFTCMKKYIQQVQPKFKTVDVASISSATLKLLPGFIATNSSSVLPSFELTLKNDSSLTIVVVVIKVKNIRTGQESLYRLNGERPISPLTVGQLRAYSTPITNPTEFWATHSWGLNTVWGVD